MHSETVQRLFTTTEAAANQTSQVRELVIPRAAPGIGEYGFRLTRSKWDPYPWVSEVASGTPAAVCRLKAGDCVLEVNGLDILGMRVVEVSKLVNSQSDCVKLRLWSSISTSTSDSTSTCQLDCDQSSICCAPMTTSLKRLSVVVQNVLNVIECPVCTTTITPPALQCQNGHLLCLNCRIRAEKCPICRDYYTPRRALIAEQIYTAIASAFNLCSGNGGYNLRHKLFGLAQREKESISCGSSDTIAPAESTPIVEGLTERRRNPLLPPTNKFFTKLLQARTYSVQTLSEPNDAKLLRTSSTATTTMEQNQKQELPLKLTVTAAEANHHVKTSSSTRTMSKTRTGTRWTPSPNNVAQANGIPRHFSLSTNDLQQSPPVELGRPSGCPPHTTTNVTTLPEPPTPPPPTPLLPSVSSGLHESQVSCHMSTNNARPSMRRQATMG